MFACLHIVFNICTTTYTMLLLIFEQKAFKQFPFKYLLMAKFFFGENIIGFLCYSVVQVSFDVVVPFFRVFFFMCSHLPIWRYVTHKCVNIGKPTEYTKMLLFILKGVGITSLGLIMLKVVLFLFLQIYLLN